MGCPSVKFQHHQVTWLRLEVHACSREVTAWTELLRIGKISLRGVTGKFRLRAVKLKAGRLADNTTASIATYEPLTLERQVVTTMDSDSILSLVKAGKGKPALDFYTQGFCAASQHRFNLLHFR